MITFTILSRKGGCGKTTTCVNLAASFRNAGKRVLLIDLDSQGNLTYWSNEAAAEFTAMDLLTGTATAAEVIDNDLIPAGMELASADRLLTGSRIQFRLKNALEPVRDQYDFCIIDTPAALGVLTTNALTASDYVILTAQAEPLSIKGIEQCETIIDAVRPSNPRLKIMGILTTRYNKRTTLSRQMLDVIEQLSASMGCKVFTPIRECNALREAAAMGADIFTYAPRSNGAEDYLLLFNEIRKEIH